MHLRSSASQMHPMEVPPLQIVKAFAVNFEPVEQSPDYFIFSLGLDPQFEVKIEMCWVDNQRGPFFKFSAGKRTI